MKQPITLSVVGGDTRNLYMAQALAESGCDVTLRGFETFGGDLPAQAEESLAAALARDAVALPLPCTKNGKTLNAPFSQEEIPLRELAALIRPGSTVFAGMVSDSFRKMLEAGGARVLDYYRDEALTVKNALLTAEGVVGIIIDKTPVTVWRMKAAVTGYGRVGTFVGRLLKALGAEVTVYARSPVQRAKAEAAGLNALPLSLLAEQTHRFDVIVNTVPSTVLGEDAVCNARQDCLMVETASAPYGVDFDACRARGIELVKAFSLPGRTAPKTAGILIADAILGMMKEANLWNP